MDDEHESEEPTGTTVEGSAPAEAVTPGPPAFIAVPGSTYTGAGGWSWTPPPPPPPPAPPFPGVTGSSTPVPAAGPGRLHRLRRPAAPGPPGTVGAGTQWVGTPGPYWAVLPIPQLKRLQAPTALLVVALLVIGMAAGFGIGQVAWQSVRHPPRCHRQARPPRARRASRSARGHCRRLGHTAVRLGNLRRSARDRRRLGLDLDASGGPAEPVGNRPRCRPWPCGCEYHPQLLAARRRPARGSSSLPPVRCSPTIT